MDSPFRRGRGRGWLSPILSRVPSLPASPGRCLNQRQEVPPPRSALMTYVYVRRADVNIFFKKGQVSQRKEGRSYCWRDRRPPGAGPRSLGGATGAHG